MPDDFKSFIRQSLQRVEKKDYTWFFIFGDSLHVDTESPWRLVTADGIAVTSEDHKQQFGLPEPVDAAERVTSQLATLQVQSVACDAKTGDFFISFAERLYLHFLQMSCGYESWRITTTRGQSICMGGGEIAFFPTVKKI